MKHFAIGLHFIDTIVRKWFPAKVNTYVHDQDNLLENTDKNRNKLHSINIFLQLLELRINARDNLVKGSFIVYFCK